MPHRRDGQVKISITLEGLCKLIRTHREIPGYKVNDLVPSHVYVDHERGIINLIATQEGNSRLNRKAVCEGGEIPVIMHITTEDITTINN